MIKWETWKKYSYIEFKKRIFSLKFIDIIPNERLFIIALILDHWNQEHNEDILNIGINFLNDYLNQSITQEEKLYIYDLKGYAYLVLIDVLKLWPRDSNNIRHPYLLEVKQICRDAIEICMNSPDLMNNNLFALIIIRYANILSTLGRYCDAITEYGRIPKKSLYYGIAQGNMGIALGELVLAMPNGYSMKTLEYAILKLDLGIEKSIENLATKEVINWFKQKRMMFELALKDNAIMCDYLLPNRFYRYDKSIKPFINFCRLNDLFLSIHRYVKWKKPIRDTLGRELQHLEPKYAQFFNEIQEEYAVARFLLYQGQTSMLNPMIDINHYISGITCFLETEKDLIHWLSSGIIKSAYTKIFNILDKIGLFINRYLNLWILENKIYFKWRENENLFCEEWKLRKEIIDTFQYLQWDEKKCLVAIIDIQDDFQKDKYFNVLGKLRNTMIHKNVKIYDIGDYIEQNDWEIDIENLEETLSHLLILLKNTIIYLWLFIKMHEEIKQKYDSNK